MHTGYRHLLLQNFQKGTLSYMQLPVEHKGSVTVALLRIQLQLYNQKN